MFKGVIEFCGMEKASINRPMSVVNLDFQIIDRFMAYFGQRLSQAKADWGKAWVVLIPGLRWRSFCRMHMDILNLTFSKGMDNSWDPHWPALEWALSLSACTQTILHVRVDIWPLDALLTTYLVALTLCKLTWQGD